MDSEERETIKVVDRRRFILDDDGEVHERDPEQKVVAVSSDGVVEPAEDPEPPRASAKTSTSPGGRGRRVRSFFRRIRERFRLQR